MQKEPSYTFVRASPTLTLTVTLALALTLALTLTQLEKDRARAAEERRKAQELLIKAKNSYRVARHPDRYAGRFNIQKAKQQVGLHTAFARTGRQLLIVVWHRRTIAKMDHSSAIHTICVLEQVTAVVVVKLKIREQPATNGADLYSNIHTQDRVANPTHLA